MLTNIALYAYYWERTYPQTRVMNANVGNLAYSYLKDKMRDTDPVPEKVQLTYDNLSTDVALADLGVDADYDKLVANARASRLWLPVANLLTTHTLDPPVTVDEDTLRRGAEDLKHTFQKAPVDAHLTLDNGEFRVIDDRNGYELEVGQLQEAIMGALKAGQRTITAPVKVLSAATQSPDLDEKRRTLQNQLSASLVYRYKGSSIKPSAQEISAWYVPLGNTYAVSDVRVRSYILKASDGFGIRPQNLSQLVFDTKRALGDHSSFDGNLVPFSKTSAFTYCVAGKNVDSSYLADLANWADISYNHERGWSLDGQIAFKRVDSNCDYTLWLSSADQMDSFSPICDAEWSCQAGDDVIINFDRWQNASPAWRSHGGSLEDYRHMVINHETGHWLGFGHSDCGSAGQPAPVMQQQSIDLQGCAFNPWPTSSEQDVLRQLLGL